MCLLREAFGSLSVVIPALNARDVVCDTLDAVQTYLQRAGLEHEIIVVDDGSTDDTAEIVTRRGHGVTLLRLDRNRGKGAAVRAGMLRSKLAWALFMDVDHSTGIEHLERFAQHVHAADVLIGSRRLDGSRILCTQPALRQTLGKTFPHLVRWVALPALRDTQCGFKVFRRDVVDQVFRLQKSAGFCFDVEVLLISSRLGYRIAEIPIDWDNPHASTIRVWKDPARMLVDLFRIVRRHRAARQSPLPRPSRGEVSR